MKINRDKWQTAKLRRIKGATSNFNSRLYKSFIPRVYTANTESLNTTLRNKLIYHSVIKFFETDETPDGGERSRLPSESSGTYSMIEKRPVHVVSRTDRLFREGQVWVECIDLLTCILIRSRHITHSHSSARHARSSPGTREITT